MGSDSKQEELPPGGQRDRLKVDLLQQGPPQLLGSFSTPDLKGTPVAGGESGSLTLLHPKVEKARRIGKAVAEQRAAVKKLASSSSASSSTAVPSSASASSCPPPSGRRKDSARMELGRTPAAKAEVGSSRRASTKMARPWQVLGEAETTLDVEHPEEDFPARGVAEATLAGEQVMAFAKIKRAAAWAVLRKEFGVQQMIWESVAFMKKAHMAAAGKAAAADEPVEAVMVKAFESVLNKESTGDADAACAELEETLSKNDKEYNMLSKPMRDTARGCIDAEAMFRKHLALADACQAAAAAPAGFPIGDNPTPAPPARNSEPAKKLEELSALLLHCELGRTPLTYMVRRILCWSLGGPESGLIIPLSSAWAPKEDDSYDPWKYDDPDPSIQESQFADALQTKELKTARSDLTSLQKKKKASDSLTPRSADAEVSSPKLDAPIGANANSPPPSQPPAQPPRARLPELPGFAMADPQTWGPCDPAGPSQSQTSTSTGSSSAPSGGSGGERTEHRTRLIVQI